MIAFRSLLTGVAKLPAVNQASVAGMSSPGGEETGEGELCSRGRQSALIKVGRAWDASLLASRPFRPFCHSVQISAPPGLCGPEKGRNCKTNPILFASGYRLTANEEKFFHFIISKDYYATIGPPNLAEALTMTGWLGLPSLLYPGTNQPKSTLQYKKANQKPANADQKKKSSLDSSCEGTAFWAETFNFEPLPRYTWCNLQPIWTLPAPRQLSPELVMHPKFVTFSGDCPII
jgi:hypothetical protein